MLYKIDIRKCHSLTLGVTPSQHLLTWIHFSNSNYDELRLPRFQLRLPRSNDAHALPSHPIQYELLPCSRRIRRDHKKQFRGISLPTTCPKTTSAAWTLPSWPLPSGITIGPSSTYPTLSFNPSPEKKWNTWHLRKTSVDNHLGHEALATNVDAYSKAFMQFLESTHVSVSNSPTSQNR
jgi:hypothetical protein